MKEGRCLLCGEVGKLTFEHTPPRAAFNSDPARFFEGAELLKERGRYTPSQRGIGKRCFCANCNSFLGTTYAKEYISWANQAHSLLARLDDGPLGTYLFWGNCNLFAKQLLAIIVASSGPSFCDNNSIIRDLILDPRRCASRLPFSLNLAYYKGNSFRQSGVFGRFNSDSGRQEIGCEFAYYPFHIYLALDGGCSDGRFTDLTYFLADTPRALRGYPLRLGMTNLEGYLPMNNG